MIQEKESGVNLLNFEEAAPGRVMGPVVKAKATSLMSSIMISKSAKTTEPLTLLNVFRCTCDADNSELYIRVLHQ